MNRDQSVPEEHFLLTALFTTCFQWRLRPIKQDLVSWTSSYWYKLQSIGWHRIFVTRTHLTLRIFRLKFECPPNVQVNLGAEGSINRWNSLPCMRSEQDNDNLLSGALFWKPSKTLIWARTTESALSLPKLLILVLWTHSIHNICN